MRLVVFDMDGTLVDSSALIVAHTQETFKAHGLPLPTPDAARAVIGLSLEYAMMRLADCDEDKGHALAETYRTAYRAQLAKGGDHEPLYPGVVAALERLAAQEETLIGLATGKRLHGARRVLELHGIAEHFVTLQTPDHNPSKPHPGMLLRAMEETGVDARHTVMIGDTTFDMELARSAGTKAIGVTWGYHPRLQLEEAGAHRIVEDYGDLVDAIERVLD